MNKNKKILYIQESLEKLYPNPKISLNYCNKFTFLISVLLSARTTDKKVNEVTKELFKVANSAEKMQELSIKEIKNYIQKIGLYNNKAKNIYLLSRKLITKYNGKIPSSFKELESLPGVGHKTASVIISEIFKIPAFPIDTHIHRLAKLWQLTSGKTVKQTEKDLKIIFPTERWRVLHLQIISYGREYSPARNWSLERDFITRNIFYK